MIIRAQSPNFGGFMKKSNKYLIYAIVFLVLAGIVVYSLMSSMATKEVNTTDFFKKAGVLTVQSETQLDPDSNQDGHLEYKVNEVVYEVLFDGRKNNFIIVAGGELTSIEVNTYNLVGYVKKGGDVYAYKTSYPRDDQYSKILWALQDAGLSVNYTDPNAGSLFSSLIVPLLTIGVGILILFVFMRQAQGSNKNAIDFGKPQRARSFFRRSGGRRGKARATRSSGIFKESQKILYLRRKDSQGRFISRPSGNG